MAETETQIDARSLQVVTIETPDRKKEVNVQYVWFADDKPIPHMLYPLLNQEVMVTNYMSTSNEHIPVEVYSDSLGTTNLGSDILTWQNVCYEYEGEIETYVPRDWEYFFHAKIADYTYGAEEVKDVVFLECNPRQGDTNPHREDYLGYDTYVLIDENGEFIQAEEELSSHQEIYYAPCPFVEYTAGSGRGCFPLESGITDIGQVFRVSGVAITSDRTTTQATIYLNDPLNNDRVSCVYFINYGSGTQWQMSADGNLHDDWSVAQATYNGGSRTEEWFNNLDWQESSFKGVEMDFTAENNQCVLFVFKGQEGTIDVSFSEA